MVTKFYYTGSPRKNATTFIVNFMNIVDETESFFIFFGRTFIFQQMTPWSLVLGNVQGRIQDLKKGGTTHCCCFFGPPPASKVAQVPKKLMGGGGGTPTLFFSERHQCRESRNSQTGGGDPTHLCFCFFRFQKGGGGTPTLFFQERHQRRESRKSQRGGGGGGIRHITVFRHIFFFFFFRFQKGGGGHMYKRGGGQMYKNVSKGGGARAGCAPPPKSATGNVSGL